MSQRYETLHRFFDIVLSKDTKDSSVIVIETEDSLQVMALRSRYEKRLLESFVLEYNKVCGELWSRRGPLPDVVACIILHYIRDLYSTEKERLLQDIANKRISVDDIDLACCLVGETSMEDEGSTPRKIYSTYSIFQNYEFKLITRQSWLVGGLDPKEILKSVKQIYREPQKKKLKRSKGTAKALVNWEPTIPLTDNQ